MTLLLHLWACIFGSGRPEEKRLLDDPNFLFTPPVDFIGLRANRFITGDFERAILKDIDKVDVVDTNVLVSPLFGGITSDRISGTAKTLIVAKNFPDKIVDLDCMGNNGAKWLLKIAEKQDITAHLGRFIDFPEPYTVHILNNDTYAHNLEELVQCAGPYINV